MGVAITQLLEGKELSLPELRGKVVAIDAFNMLYQFLTTIRMRDGTPLTDSKGAVTSHLIGLLARSTTLMAEGLKLIFVFDGEPPALKLEERERRAAAKAEALQHYKEAQAAEDLEAMQKYAGRTAKLTPRMVEEAKELVASLGLPVVQAPSEGEAEAAHLVKNGTAWAVVSQDADALLFGAPRVIRNLNLSNRRKRTNALAYETVKPELLSLHDTLAKLQLTREQLIILSILVGTDYNRAGIKGVGPKKALKLLAEHKSNYEALFKAVNWKEQYPELDWQTILKTFKEMPVVDALPTWRPENEEALRRLLVEEHGFSEERIKRALGKLTTAAASQKGLQEFF